MPQRVHLLAKGLPKDSCGELTPRTRCPGAARTDKSTGRILNRRHQRRAQPARCRASRSCRPLCSHQQRGDAPSPTATASHAATSDGWSSRAALSAAEPPRALGLLLWYATAASSRLSMFNSVCAIWTVKRPSRHCWCPLGSGSVYSEIQGIGLAREALVLLRLRRLDLADCAGEDPLARDWWTRRFRGSLRLGHSCWLCVFAAAHRRHGLGAAAAVRYQPSIRYPACRDMERTVPPPPRPTVTSCIRA